MRLDRSFFYRPTLQVTQDLLGKKLVFGSHEGLITETEAYIGQNDPACHAARGRTPRTEVMFGKPGYTYVYLIYGLYYCLNFVTEEEGFPAAVLIRGLRLTIPPYTHLNGPGKLCGYLGITKFHNKIDLVTSPEFYMEKTDQKVLFEQTPRIGIKAGTDKLWRFIEKPLTTRRKA